MNFSSLSLSLSLLLLLLFTLSYLQTPTPPPNHLSPNPNPLPQSPNPKPPHPLDPLTVPELSLARSILLSHPPFSSSPSSLIFHSLSLDPPAKPPLPLPPRRALALLQFHSQFHSLSIDLSTNSLSSLPTPQSGYPTMTIDDMTASAAAPLSNPAFNRSVIARGVRTEDLSCLPVSSGWFGREIENRRRLIKVQCYSVEGTANFYMRPIEGLTVLVDLDTREVVEVRDVGGGIPVAKSEGTDYRFGVVKGNYEGRALKPISIEQTEGVSFEVVDGHR